MIFINKSIFLLALMSFSLFGNEIIFERDSFILREGSYVAHSLQLVILTEGKEIFSKRIKRNTLIPLDLNPGRYEFEIRFTSRVHGNITRKYVFNNSGLVNKHKFVIGKSMQISNQNFFAEKKYGYGFWSYQSSGQLSSPTKIYILPQRDFDYKTKAKLDKLDSMYDDGLISEDDYLRRRKIIFDN